MSSALMPCRRSLMVLLLFLDELEPEEATGAEREQIGELADAWEARVPEQLNRIAALERAQIELHRLRRASDVVHAQDLVVLEGAQVGEDARIGGLDRFVGTEDDHRVLLAERDEAMQPAQQARRGSELRFDIHCLEAVHGVHQRWRVKLGKVAAGAAAVAVSGPPPPG